MAQLSKAQTDALKTLDDLMAQAEASDKPGVSAHAKTLSVIRKGLESEFTVLGAMLAEKPAPTPAPVA
jgi:hypothetical protein